MRKVLLATAAALLLPAAASAGTMILSFNHGASTLLNGAISFDSGASYLNVGVGRLAFTMQPGGTDPLDPNPVGPLVYTYCIEPTEWVTPANSTYDRVDLHLGNTTMGGIGVTKANLIRRLVEANNVDLEGVVAATTAAAAQFAIWEIVKETTGSYDVLAGSARFSTGASGVLTLAQTYLLSAFTPGPLRADLYAVNAIGRQDQMIWGHVPEPAALSLFGLGIVGLALRRRAKR